jgi:hypothetical protein
MADVPETLAHAGLKTLATLQFVLGRSDWEATWISNTSSYVRLDELQNWMEGRSGQGVYAGARTVYRGNEFVSGTGVFMSRDVVEAVVANREEWEHDFLIDVALGRLCGRLGIGITHIPRLDIPHASFLDTVEPGEVLSYLHFRCKSNPRPEEEIRIMQRLHLLASGGAACV